MELIELMRTDWSPEYARPMTDEESEGRNTVLLLIASVCPTVPCITEKREATAKQNPSKIITGVHPMVTEALGDTNTRSEVPRSTKTEEKGAVPIC
jgi:hypothetical protein